MNLKSFRWIFYFALFCLMHSWSEQSNKETSSIDKGDIATEMKMFSWQGMFHVWHFAASVLPEGRQAIDRIGKFIGQMCSRLEGVESK